MASPELPKFYITPILRCVSSTDWDEYIRTGVRHCSMPFDIEIGELDSRGADLFKIEVINDLMIKNEQLIVEHGKIEGWCSRRGKLFLNFIDLKKIQFHVQEKIDQLGPYESWVDFAEKVSHYLIWEFEGMPPHHSLW